MKTKKQIMDKIAELRRDKNWLIEKRDYLVATNENGIETIEIQACNSLIEKEKDKLFWLEWVTE